MNDNYQNTGWYNAYTMLAKKANITTSRMSGAPLIIIDGKL